jgi:hypothetical protein
MRTFANRKCTSITRSALLETLIQVPGVSSVILVVEAVALRKMLVGKDRSPRLMLSTNKIRQHESLQKVALAKT